VYLHGTPPSDVLPPFFVLPERSGKSLPGVSYPATPPVALLGERRAAPPGTRRPCFPVVSPRAAEEAVVPFQAPNPLGGSFLLAFDNTNGVLTGVALEMISDAGGTIVPVTLRDENGVQIGTGTESITLAQGDHTSFVLSTQFPVTANIRGTVAFGAPCIMQRGPGPGTFVCSDLSVLGIRYTPPGTLTTIPPLPDIIFGGGSIPHLASGNGWQTTFVLVNGDTLQGHTAQISFFDDNGNPLWLPLTFPQSGIQTHAASVTAGIDAGASLWIETTGPVGSPLLSGSAQLTNSNSISAFGIFRYNPNGQEAALPLETRNAGAYLLAFDNTNGTATGVAISDISTAQAAAVSSQINGVGIPLAALFVPVILRDDTGAQIGTGSIPLAANGHTSFVLASQFPVTAGIRGTVEFDTPGFGSGTPAQISVLGIRSPPALTFTTLPALAK
jgi:hypothetical protein